MPRELTAAQQLVIDSNDFRYYDCVEVQLPFATGDPVPITIRASTASISLDPAQDFLNFIYSAFAALARAPTVAEEDAWLGALEVAFDVDTATLLSVADGLVDGLFVSTEYTNRDRTDIQFVEDLYLGYLGRVADPGGKSFWVNELLTQSRADVRNAFGVEAEFGIRMGNLNQVQAFESDIREMGTTTLSDGRAQDGSSLALQNLENTYSTYLGETTRRLYPAPCVLQRAFKIADGSYKADTLLVGLTRFDSVNGQNANLTLTSDMSRKGLDVILPVTQRCRHVYKGPGCESPDPSDTCSRIFDDADNGCAAKLPAPRITDGAVTNNQPSFGGVPPLNPSGTGTGGGVIDTGLPPADELPPSGWPNDFDPDDPRWRHQTRQFGLLQP